MIRLRETYRNEKTFAKKEENKENAVEKAKQRKFAVFAK